MEGVQGLSIFILMIQFYSNIFVQKKQNSFLIMRIGIIVSKSYMNVLLPVNNINGQQLVENECLSNYLKRNGIFLCG